MRKCKYKKIYSKGKKHPTHFQRRSFKEQCRKYNKCKKTKQSISIYSNQKILTETTRIIQILMAL